MMECRSPLIVVLTIKAKRLLTPNFSLVGMGEGGEERENMHCLLQS